MCRVFALLLLFGGLVGGCHDGRYYSLASDWTPRSALMAAIANDEGQNAETILKASMEDVNLPRRHNTDGRLGDLEVGAPTPIMFATQMDSAEMVRLLLKYDADPRPGDPNQDALAYAKNLDEYRKSNGEKRSKVVEILRGAEWRRALSGER